MDFIKKKKKLKSNNIGLALGAALKFYTSLEKGLKLKVRMFWWPICTFVEVCTPRVLNKVKIFILDIIVVLCALNSLTSLMNFSLPLNL